MPPTSPKTPERGEAHIRDRVRDRGDACPGALRLHRADDGALARLRLPTGILTARQVEVLAGAADRLGDGRLGVTSRGNIELRGLGDGCGRDLADLLRGAGLLPSEQHERIRNMVVSPLTGLDGPDGPGRADVREWAARLDGLLCAEPWTAALSGRFLFAVDDGRGDVARLGADVTLIAESDGRALLRVGPRGHRVAAADAPRAALAAAEAFLAAAREAGTGAWRVAELPAGQDVDVTGRLERRGIAATEAAPGPLPAGRPPAPGLVGPAGGPTAVSAVAPLGRITTAQLRALLPAPADEVRVTPWRGFVVPGFPGAGAARERLAALGAAGLITRTDSPWPAVSACTGRPGCAKSLSDVRADARPLDGTPPAGGPGPAGAALPVHWSGCARRCGHPQGEWVDAVATSDGVYEVTVRAPGHDTPPATVHVPRRDAPPGAPPHDAPTPDVPPRDDAPRRDAT
ncbi:cobalamin biosynthesis protein CobG [Streptomyces sp. NPDC050856]|uniref:cobalamin biosynthesis protein CobG n=1 Tax=Streptomyces sp. NPDC050856 TaxID=3154939 RepID=UPI00340AB54F